MPGFQQSPWLTKLNANASVAWSRRYDFANVHDVLEVTGGYLILAIDQGTTVGRMVLARVDAVGQLVWQKAYGDGGHYPKALVPAVGGGAVLLATAPGAPDASSIDNDTAVIHVDGTGAVLASVKIAGAGSYGAVTNDQVPKLTIGLISEFAQGGAAAYRVDLGATGRH